MRIIRTPLRLSIVGGGTDIPSWYENHGGLFVTAAIDKYIYTTVHRSPYDKRIRVRYSKMEEVDEVGDIQNEIVRETLMVMNVKDSIEITSHAEIPSGTGLGSSGAFGVGLVHSLKPNSTPEELAKSATAIQAGNLRYPIGWQDQIASAFGGVLKVTIGDGVEVNSFDAGNVPIEKLALFYTGIKRNTNEVLIKSSDEGLGKIQKLAKQFTLMPRDYGLILKEHWEYKKKRGGMTDDRIDELYNIAMKNGAVGGKIVGAGGGGFLLFYTDDKEKLIDAMPVPYQPFKWDFEGSKVIYEK